jgi:hypothetical protein
MMPKCCSVRSDSHFSQFGPIMIMNSISIRLSVCLTGHRACQSEKRKSGRETQATQVWNADMDIRFLVSKAVGIEKSSVQ